MPKSTITIRFRGLCAFVEQARAMDAYLLDAGPVGGLDEVSLLESPHQPTLAIPIKHIDTATTTWRPTAIADTADGEQLGIWRITAGDELSLDLPGTLERPKWDQRPLSIDLRQLHAGDKSKALKREKILAKGAAVFILVNGVMACPELVDEDLRLARDGNLGDPRNIARTVIWRVSGNDVAPKIEVKSGGRTFHIKLLVNATATVTNAAPVSDGLGHFHHYYGIFKDDRVKQFSLKRPGLFGRDDVPVYDCIPPAGGPDPEP